MFSHEHDDDRTTLCLISWFSWFSFLGQDLKIIQLLTEWFGRHQVALKLIECNEGSKNCNFGKSKHEYLYAEELCENLQKKANSYEQF